MIYDAGEYYETFLKGNTGEQISLKEGVQADKELGLASLIIIQLNKKKYDSLEDFIKRNVSYQDFLKNNNSDIAVTHFGKLNKSTISEADFTKVLNNLRILTKNMQTFETKDIKTTNIDNKEYNSFEGNDKTYFFDNSSSSKSIEGQMKDLQPTQQNFQTADPKQNTENMFKELEKTKKESLKLNYLNEISYDLLTNEQKELFQAANNYQQTIIGTIKVDLDRGIMVDEQNNIMKIEKENGKYLVKMDNDGTEKQHIDTKEIAYQKQLTLKPNPNTIYSDVA